MLKTCILQSLLPQRSKNKFVLQSRLKYLFDPSIFITFQ